MTNTKNTHGGAGRHQGNKPLYEEKMVLVNVRITPEMRDKALRWGQGNLSAGVRMALSFQDARLPPTD